MAQLVIQDEKYLAWQSGAMTWWQASDTLVHLVLSQATVLSNSSVFHVCTLLLRALYRLLWLQEMR